MQPFSESYRRNKERAAARSRSVSLAGREIAPLPPIADPRRRAEGSFSLLAFCKSYFPMKFKKAFGSCHLQLIDALERVICDGGKQAVAMPRGSGKSTICKAAVVWGVLTRKRRFVVVVCANAREAKNCLRAIYSDVSTNPLLVADFPEVCYPLHLLKGSQSLARGQLLNGEPTASVFNSQIIRFPTVDGSDVSGATIAAYGVNAALRGMAVENPDGSTDRPDCLFLDDLSTDKLALNPNRVAELENKVAGTLEGLAGAGETLAMMQTCTVIAPDDYADRILNKELYPRWNGVRIAALDSFPEDEAAWREYGAIWAEDPEKATEFYRANLERMRKGAVVTWPESYSGGDCVDTLEYLMRKKIENPTAFAAEQMNQPIQGDTGNVKLSAKVIRSKVNGYDRGLVPSASSRLTAGVDVHGDVLYWVVVAWSDMFTGRIVDYGTFPEQRRAYFSKNDGGLETLERIFSGLTIQGRVYEGLVALLSELREREFPTEKEGDFRRIDRILVDEGWEPTVVASAARAIDERLVVTSKGFSIRATSSPMQYWPKRQGRSKGWHMIDERVDDAAIQRTRAMFLLDVNYMKSTLHSMFALAPGEKDSFSLFGKEPEVHRMFSDHLAAETAKLVVCASNRVVEWSPNINRPDNHFFDCCVMALAGGISLGGRPADYPNRR